MVESVAVTQVPPTARVVQQPEQDWPSQKHCPPRHTWPEAHGLPVPHWQTPAVQVSVV